MERLAHDWFAAQLPRNVVISDRSWVYSSYAFLHYRSTQPIGVRIGTDSGIYDGTFFDLGPNGCIRIGDFSTIVGAVIKSDGPVEIGDYCLIAHEVVLSDDPCGIPGASASMSGGGDQRQAIRIGNNCWIATGAILLGGAQIGDNSIVAAHCVVDFNVPAGKMVVGNPSRILNLPELANSIVRRDDYTEGGA